MPRTALTVTTITRTGVARPAQEVGDVANGNSIAGNDGRIFLEITNDDAATQTVTFQTPGTVDGLAIADLVISLLAGDVKLVGPLTPGTFNQSDGLVYVDPSDADLKFRVYRAP